MSDTARVTSGPVTIPQPSGWEDRTVLTLVGPPTEGAQPNVVVTREALCANMGLGGFSSGWVQKLADQVPVREAKAIEHIEISGAPAHLRVVEWEAAGLRLRQMVGLTTIGGDGYAIVCTVPSAAYDALESELRAVIEGTRIDSADAGDA
ncbi:MAG: DcrB-related protein [Gaiellales bacterium]